MSKPLNEQLKTARLDKGLSLRKLGDIAGVPYVTIHEAEQERGNPTYRTLARLAVSLEIDLIISKQTKGH